MIPTAIGHALERVKLGLLIGTGLLEILLYSSYRVPFWVARRMGLAGQVERKTQRMARDWAVRILARVRCRVEVEGLEHVPLTGPLVVMANHQSQFDIPILMGQLGRLMGFVAKKELFRIPGFAYWMRQLGCVALDRGSPREAMRLFDELSAAIKLNGSGIILFPEGTRNRLPDAPIAPFKEGSLRLATGEQLPILPVAIDGSRFLSKAAPLWRTRRGGRLVRVKIAPAVASDARSAVERRKLMESIRDTIVANFAAIRVTWPAPEAGGQPSPTGAVPRAAPPAASGSARPMR